MSYYPTEIPTDPIEAYYSDYKSGRSLFGLSFKYTIDAPMLWTFFVYLLMFMIAIDTIQRIALRFAGDDRCWVMFVNRCISELMMFGAVAISILLIDEIMRKTLPYIRKDQIHWVDVFCSISACLLILVGYWAFVLVVRPREYYRSMMDGPLDGKALDFIVFGGKITRQLAEDYGLREVYDFGDYVREISGQLIAELIDVNLCTWVAFGLPPLVGVIATHINEAAAVEAFTSNMTESYYALKQFGPTPTPTAVELFLGIGWIWFAASLALEYVVLDAMNKLRRLYGFNCTETAKRAVEAIEQSALDDLRDQMQSTPLRRQSIEPAGALSFGSDAGRPGSKSRHEAPPSTLATIGSGEIELHGRSVKSSKSTVAPEASEATSNGMDRNVTFASASHEKSADFALRAELVSRNLQRQKTMGPGLACKDFASLLKDSDATEEALPDPKAHIWAARHLDLLKQLLQIIMLYSCGQVALYSLSLAYGINSSRIGGAWHLFALFPPLTTVFGLLPHLCYSIATFEAYAVPNAPILDNVISDLDQRTMDHAYIKSQLEKRADAAAESHGHRFGRNLGARLERFEREFDENHTLLGRWWSAFVDLARGQALCFVDRKACFLVGVLDICMVPVSRERLERLVPWFKSEVAIAHDLHVSDLFEILGIEPPRLCCKHDSAGRSVKGRNTSNASNASKVSASSV